MPGLDNICTFCHEVKGSSASNLFYDKQISAPGATDYILDETDHFVVIPCIGALVDDYVLIVSRRHILSAGWLDATERDDLRQLIDRWSRRFADTSNNVVLFEHGSYDFRDKGGACYDHAHLHLIATAADPAAFLASVAQDVTMDACPDWLAAATDAVNQDRRSYLAMSTTTQHYIGNSQTARSQFFRRHLARWLGAEPGSWDWLVFPEIDRVRSMMHKFGASPVRE